MILCKRGLLRLGGGLERPSRGLLPEVADSVNHLQETKLGVFEFRKAPRAPRRRRCPVVPKAYRYWFVGCRSRDARGVSRRLVRAKDTSKRVGLDGLVVPKTFTSAIKAYLVLPTSTLPLDISWTVMARLEFQLLMYVVRAHFHGLITAEKKLVFGRWQRTIILSILSERDVLTSYRVVLYLTPRVTSVTQLLERFGVPVEDEGRRLSVTRTVGGKGSSASVNGCSVKVRPRGIP